MAKLKITKRYTYPHNLINAVHGREVPDEQLPPDLKEGVDFLIMKMPEREGRILAMKYKEGLSTREIGERIGVSTQRVHQLLRRCERMLRNAVNGPYLLNGLAAIRMQEEERKPIERMNRRLQILEGLDSARGVPIHEIMDGRERVDAILSRSRLGMILEISPSAQLYNSLTFGGFRYIWELCFAMPHEVLRRRNIRERQLVVIEAMLKKYGLALDDGVLSSDPCLWDYAEQRFAEVITEMDMESDSHVNG